MNLITLTIDLDTHAVVPREATLTMAVAGKMEANRHNQGNEQMECVYKHMLAAAPPYQSAQVLNMVWIPVSERIPDVTTGKCKEFIATYFKPYSSKLSVGVVSYLNCMDVPDEDTESDESEIALSGWFATEKNYDGDEAWFRRSVIGWMNKPDAMPLAAPKGEE